MKLSDFKTKGMPDGARHIQLENGHPEGDRLTATIRSTEDLMDLCVVSSALESLGRRPDKLRLTYFPGRQDRHTAPGSPFTLSVIGSMIDWCGYTDVEIYEPHSPESLKQISFSRATSMAPAAYQFRDWLGWYTGELVIVAPDKGALERAAAIRTLTGGELIHADKTRDPETGNITGMKLVTEGVPLKGSRVLVVDDLCDGGATFAALGDLLRGAEVKSLALFVAHGIFSRGLATLRAYDHVGTTDSFYHADRNLNVKMFPAFPDEEIK